MAATSNSLTTATYDVGCVRCERLASFLADVRQRFPDYHALPVPSFGDERARLLIVGLAPGMHGANRTGRPFTGDHAGMLLYETLHQYGFANRADALQIDDGLELTDCRITNAVKCLPPQNKPVAAEVAHCSDYLRNEINALPADAVIMCLGGLAHGAVLRVLGLRKLAYPFGHAHVHELPEGRILVDSYHCSRYNTQTGRLTPPMFQQVFDKITHILGTRA